jgi:hypothetical protein
MAILRGGMSLCWHPLPFRAKRDGQSTPSADQAAMLKLTDSDTRVLTVEPGFTLTKKDHEGDDFLFRFGDDFLSHPRRAAAVGLTPTLLIIERSVREAPLK